MRARLLAGLLLAALCAGAAPVAAQAPVDVTFYYPVGVGGPVTEIIVGLAADFNRALVEMKVTDASSGKCVPLAEAL